MKTKRVSIVRDAAGRGSPREKLLAYAAGRIFSEGFSALTVDEICGDLGMSKRTFYRVFASKEALVRDLIEGMLARVGGEIDGILARKDPFPVRIHAMMTFMATAIRRLGKPLLRDLERHTPAIWEHIQSFRRERVLMLVGRMLEEGRREGSIRPGVDPRVFLLSYLGAIEAVLVPGVLVHESFSAEDALEGILTIFFLGALTEQPAAQLRSLLQPIT